jgi:hypothetical protein
MKPSFGLGSRGRRLAGLAAGAGLVLLAGTPRSMAGEPPPSLPVCWAEFITSLNWCWHNFGQVHNFNLAGYRACVKGMQDAYEWCLGRSPAPDPAPTRSSCALRFADIVMFCMHRYPDPCFPNPDPPGGCTPDPDRNIAQNACLEAARLEYNKCLSFVPPAMGTLGRLTLSPGIIRVEPQSKYLNVTITVERFGNADWTQVDVTYAQPNPADPGNPRAWVHTPAEPIRKWASALGDKPTAVTLNIPPSVYDHANELILVFFDLKPEFGVDPIAGDAVVLRVMYGEHDLNRDGRVDNADVLIALTRYFNGEFTWAQYQAVLRAAGR